MLQDIPLLCAVPLGFAHVFLLSYWVSYFHLFFLCLPLALAFITRCSPSRGPILGFPPFCPCNHHRVSRRTLVFCPAVAYYWPSPRPTCAPPCASIAHYVFWARRLCPTGPPSYIVWLSLPRLVLPHLCYPGLPTYGPVFSLPLRVTGPLTTVWSICSSQGPSPFWLAAWCLFDLPPSLSPSCKS